MQEKHLYEYAVLRIMPKVEREEFINIGVVVYCHAKKFLRIKYNLENNRLKSFCQHLDLDTVANNLRSFELICAGGKQAGPIGALTIRERFRWLTATRSTVLQTSKAHPGFCDDVEMAMGRLFEELVG